MSVYLYPEVLCLRLNSDCEILSKWLFFKIFLAQGDNPKV